MSFNIVSWLNLTNSAILGATRCSFSAQHWQQWVVTVLSAVFVSWRSWTIASWRRSVDSTCNPTLVVRHCQTRHDPQVRWHRLDAPIWAATFSPSVRSLFPFIYLLIACSFECSEHSSCRAYNLRTLVHPKYMYRLNYCVSKKVPTLKLFVTFSNLNGFSKFVHYLKAYDICYKTHTILPTSP